MSQKRKPGTILSFFKPVARPQTPLVQSSQNSQNSRPRSPSPLPRSSPSETPVKSKTPLRRDLEIKASDDEDDFGSSSDDSLEDLSAILGRGRPNNAAPSPPKRPRSLLKTPTAKRTTKEFHSSPLAIIPKHKFDLKALAKDARKDDATNASSLKHRTTTDTSSEDEEDTSASQASQNPFVKVVKEKDAQKVLRTVQRAERGNSSLRYCFFEQDYETPPSTTVSKSLEKGPWKALTQGDVSLREENIVAGLPLALLRIKGSLPDELFDWILDELCVTTSTLLRQEYCSLIRHCAGQVEQRVTRDRLEVLFLRLGACEEIKQRGSSLILSKPSQEPYKGQEWGNLKSFLSLLGLMAPCMTLSSVMYATQTLLRMSIDKFLVYNIELLVEYEATIRALFEAIPRPSWNVFCSETCSLLVTIVKPQTLRTNILNCLPLSQALSHDLRRRLAVTFLFDDPALGRHRPDEVITIKGVIKRLKASDFSVDPKTDFAELRASIILLDIAIDDGSFVITDDPDDEAEFNRDIDELAICLRDLWRKINDAGMKLARTETKSVIEWVQQRLSHSVRTRRQAKKSVFDLPGKKPDPRQQELMKNFFKKTQSPPSPPPPLIDEDTIVVRLK